MITHFSQFNQGGAVVAGDQLVGLRAGINTIFSAPSLPEEAWTNINVAQQLFINNGYEFTNPIPATFNLPLVAAYGQILQLVSYTAQICTISQAAGQQIQAGNVATTLGIGGSIATSNIGDSITLLCIVPNLTFIVLGAPQGIWTVT